MPGLPGWAEKHFGIKCYEGGANASRPDEDRNGWDFLVEFPEKPHDGPAETRPAITTAFVQVKSTTRGETSVGIKLSNMLKACRSQTPWFIVLIAADGPGKDARFYAIHVWKELIEKSLAAVRQASIDGVPLNHRRMSVVFPPESVVVGDLVSWMLSAIKAAALDYTVEKMRLSDGLGYEAGYAVGTLTVAASSSEEITRAFLGLGTGLTVKNFKMTPIRFGIPDPMPLIDVTEGHLTITPTTFHPCEIRVRGPISQKALKLQGAVYGTRLPGLYENKAAFRFSAPPLEIVHVPGGANIWNLNIHTSDVRSLRFLSSFSMLRNWSRSGPLELEVWLQGHRAFGGTVSARRETGTDLHTGLLSSILESLIQVAGEEESGRIEICIDHINAALADLIHFSKFISAGPFALSFPVNDEIPQSVTSVLYFQRVKVDCWTFGCLVLREVLKDCIDDDHRFLFAGAPVLLECHTWSAEIEGHDDPIVTAYERALLRLEKDETTLAVGDAFAYVRAKSVCEFPPSGESGGMSVRPA